MTHGTFDEVIDIRSTDGERKKMQAHGATIDWRCTTKHTRVQLKNFKIFHDGFRRVAPSNAL